MPLLHHRQADAARLHERRHAADRARARPQDDSAQGPPDHRAGRERSAARSQGGLIHGRRSAQSDCRLTREEAVRRQAADARQARRRHCRADAGSFPHAPVDADADAPRRHGRRSRRGAAGAARAARAAGDPSRSRMGLQFRRAVPARFRVHARRGAARRRWRRRAVRRRASFLDRRALAREMLPRWIDAGDQSRDHADAAARTRVREIRTRAWTS